MFDRFRFSKKKNIDYFLRYIKLTSVSSSRRTSVDRNRWKLDFKLKLEATRRSKTKKIFSSRCSLNLRVRPGLDSRLEILEPLFDPIGILVRAFVGVLKCDERTECGDVDRLPGCDWETDWGGRPSLFETVEIPLVVWLNRLRPEKKTSKFIFQSTKSNEKNFDHCSTELAALLKEKSTNSV